MKRVPHLLILLALSLSAGTRLVAQTPAYDLPVREHVFPNGLRLLVLERPADHRVAAKIFTDFGAIAELPGELGAAHFLEHLMFKGTPTLGTTDWAAERPFVEQLRATERELIEALNAARNDLRQRGVFHDYQHAESTPRIDSLRAEIARLDGEIARFRDNGAMMRWYQAYGGTNLTATTEQEYMKFDINLPAERVDLFLRVEADRMRNSIFREFDQERMILVEQRFGDLNRPVTPYSEAVNAVAGTIHPVYWPEGYLSDFPQYTRAYERKLYEEFFVPNNTTLVFVGGVSLDEMIPKVEQYFGWMQRAPEPARTQAIEPVPVAEQRLVWRSDSLEPRVELRYRIPGVGHPDRPHFDVLAEVAVPALRDAFARAGLRASASANTRVVHTSRFGIPATLNFEAVAADPVQLEDIERVLTGTIEGLATATVQPAELQSAKKFLRTEWHRIARNPDALGFEIGHFQTMDSWRTLPRYLAAREATDGAAIQRLAERYFIPANRIVAIVRPPQMPASATEGF